MTLSPINQKHIQTTKANNANTASVNVAPKVNVGQPQDSVELSANKKQGLIDKIKANKKILIPAAIGIAALAGGVIYGIKTGKISFKGNIEKKASEIIDKGNKLKQRGAELAEEGKKQYGEVLALIKKGQENGFEDFRDGSKLIRFSGDELKKTMREYEGDKLLREAYFELFGEDYRITTINKNIEELKDGTVKIKESFFFKNDKIKEYYKNATINKDDSVHFAEEFTFKNDKIEGYFKNITMNKDDSQHHAEEFNFKNDKIKTYFKNATINKDGSGHSAEAFAFDKNGKLEEFYKNYKINANHEKSWAQKYIRNEQGELVKV